MAGSRDGTKSFEIRELQTELDAEPRPVDSWHSLWLLLKPQLAIGGLKTLGVGQVGQELMGYPLFRKLLIQESTLNCKRLLMCMYIYMSQGLSYLTCHPQCNLG